MVDFTEGFFSAGLDAGGVGGVWNWSTSGRRLGSRFAQVQILLWVLKPSDHPRFRTSLEPQPMRRYTDPGKPFSSKTWPVKSIYIYIYLNENILPPTVSEDFFTLLASSRDPMAHKPRETSPALPVSPEREQKESEREREREKINKRDRGSVCVSVGV